MSLVKKCFWTLMLNLPALTAGITIDAEYDFIVVGSGAGGGPLACRLAEANFHTLLIEAGNDQGNNVNTSIPAFQGVVAQDPKIRWDVSMQLGSGMLRSLIVCTSSTSTITKTLIEQSETQNSCTMTLGKSSLAQILLSARYRKAYSTLAQVRWEDA
jgi:choline dehydrogenase-like flavoprotein